jgi:hypothetical protein
MQQTKIRRTMLPLCVGFMQSNTRDGLAQSVRQLPTGCKVQGSKADREEIFRTRPD